MVFKNFLFPLIFQISTIESQIAKLRSQLERGEAARHNLEYELTKSHREANSIKENAKKKENLLIEGTEEFKRRLINTVLFAFFS